MLTDFRLRRFVRVLGIIPFLLLPATQAAADGAFAVDGAEVGKPGECKIESWLASASNRDFAAVTAPACVVKFGVPVEIGGQLQRTRADGEWSSFGTLKAKTNLIPVANHPFGLAISGGGTWDLISGAQTSAFFAVPVTLAINDSLRLNLNGGWLYDYAVKLNYLTWGMSLEWNFVKQFTLIGEAFGQAGRLPAVAAGDPPSPAAIVEPRIQIGLRFTPKDNIDFDVLYGRNITGENANWLTTGINFRF